MAGAIIAINVEINDREVVAALRRLLSAGADMEPVFRSIGERLLINTRARFGKQESPEGVAWAPLSETTKKLKKRNKNKILTASGYLHDLLRYQASATGVEVGTDREYGAMHQFGGVTSPKSWIPGKTIPARPFLGLSEGDRQDILSIVRDHLARALGK